jgi:hypothetical protein
LFDANEKTNRAARKEEKILIYLSKILGFIIGELTFCGYQLAQLLPLNLLMAIFLLYLFFSIPI